MISEEVEQRMREEAAQQAYQDGLSCTPTVSGCKHRSCAAARVEYNRKLRRAYIEKEG